MDKIIDWVIINTRPVFLVLALLILSGAYAYIVTPKEGDPSIEVPTFYVRLSHSGISPEDAERLLLRPLEQELRSIDGLIEFSAVAFQGGASVTLEFGSGFQSQEALADIREKVNLARSDFPSDTDEPTIEEVNPATDSILVINLIGDVPERILSRMAKDLRDKIKELPTVLNADMVGARRQQMEIVIDPLKLEAYGITQQLLFSRLARNNQLIAAGSLSSERGEFPVKVAGLFKNVVDVAELPIKADGDRVVKFQDIAEIRRTFADATSFARNDGKRSISIEVSKRIGANIIDTVDAVKTLVSIEAANWQPAIDVNFSSDGSVFVRQVLSDLQNNVLAAIFLVVIVCIAALGWRNSMLVGIAVPGSVFTAFLVLYLLDLSVNTVVLVSIIIAIGMLVDGAIVVTEYADRKMVAGQTPKDAYRAAAKRMAWPIIASNLTTLVAFAPLLFWPDILGQYMKFVPITLISVLTASLVMALVFVPVMGSLFGRAGAFSIQNTKNLKMTETGDLDQVGGLTGFYVKLMRVVLHRPRIVVAGACGALFTVFFLYAVYSPGTAFFPERDPDNGLIEIRARGDMSIWERDDLVRQVERVVLGYPEIVSVYTRTGGSREGDVIGSIRLRFENWRNRTVNTNDVLSEIRRKAETIPGLHVEVRDPRGTPSGTIKPINIRVSSANSGIVSQAVDQLETAMSEVNGVRDIVDNRSSPGIEWQLDIDSYKAAQYGVDTASIGNFVQLVTNGIKVGEYRPDDADDELDIRVRYPKTFRNLDQLDNLRVATDKGPIPLSQVAVISAAPRVNTINRIDGKRVVTIEAAVEKGVLASSVIADLKTVIERLGLDRSISIVFAGQDEDQDAAESFLVQAFFVALFLMAIILVTQFNSFYQALLILTAVIFSVGGVFLGLLLLNQPFGIVMGGIGVISLAGIVVNNNIVLIDTYNMVLRTGVSQIEAVLRTGAQRLRPVLLTSVTTLLGLLPMALTINIDFFARNVETGGPVSQFWAQLATTIVGGLTFATVLTLVLTPCLLMLGKNSVRQPEFSPAIAPTAGQY